MSTRRDFVSSGDPQVVLTRRVEAEVEIMANQRRWNVVESLQPVLSAAAVQRMIDVAAALQKRGFEDVAANVLEI